jgi:hypothetical protein
MVKLGEMDKPTIRTVEVKCAKSKSFAGGKTEANTKSMTIGSGPCPSQGLRSRKSCPWVLRRKGDINQCLYALTASKLLVCSDEDSWSVIKPNADGERNFDSKEFQLIYEE